MKIEFGKRYTSKTGLPAELHAKHSDGTIEMNHAGFLVKHEADGKAVIYDEYSITKQIS